MRAELLSIGTELLLGEIVDTNSAYLAGRLRQLGVDLLHMSTVGDNLGRATETVARAWKRSDLVVATGGLGPTEDDLTREAIASALGEEPRVDATLEAHLREWFASRGGAKMPERNIKQAWLIPSARAIANPLGTAPGWSVERDGKRIVAMPGVPREMLRMWEVEVEPTLLGGSHLRARTLKLLGVGESAVEEALADVIRSTAPTVATYAKNDGVHVRLADKGTDEGAVTERIARMEALVRERLGQYVWGSDEDTLGSVVRKRLIRRGWTLATAEVLSGGEVARTLSESELGDRYSGGIVRTNGDAAALTAALEPLGADAALIVPDGASEVTIVVRTPEGTRESTIRFGSAAEGRRRSALLALDVLRRNLG